MPGALSSPRRGKWMSSSATRRQPDISSRFGLTIWIEARPALAGRMPLILRFGLSLGFRLRTFARGNLGRQLFSLLGRFLAVALLAFLIVVWCSRHVGSFCDCLAALSLPRSISRQTQQPKRQCVAAGIQEMRALARS